MSAHEAGKRGRDLLIEPFGGMAGDMFLAALLDLGDPSFGLEDLRGLAEALVPGEAKLSTETAWRGSLSGTHLTVATPETETPPHRGLADLTRMVEASPLSADSKALTIAVLTRIAVAEGHVHGCSPEEIHFHEVGAVDTLIDVGGAALGMERLGVDRVFITPPLVGSGTVRCAHGDMPVPAPATAEILRGYGHLLGGGGERLTPTGAAILVELAARGRESHPGGFVEPSGAFRTEGVGYGAGTRDPKTGPPNILRVQVGGGVESMGPVAGRSGASSGSVDELRVNLDDMSAEEVGELIQSLREAGALEVWSESVFMKKDRPAAIVCALVRPAERESLTSVLFERSSTFGVRWSSHERLEAGRAEVCVEVEGQPIRVKVRRRPDYPGRSADGDRDLFPEHDDVAAASRALAWPMREVRRAAVDAAARS